MAARTKLVVSLLTFLHTKHTSTILVCAILVVVHPEIVVSTPVLTPDDVLSVSRSQCVVAISNNRLEQTTERSARLLAIADVAFQNEPAIFVGSCDLRNFMWPSGKQLEIVEEASDLLAVVFPLLQEDRTCLQKPAYHVVYPQSVAYTGPIFADTFVDFVNTHCNTYRRPDGQLTVQGLHREYLLDNLFSVAGLPNSVSISEIFKNNNPNQQQGHCLKEDGTGQFHCTEQSVKTNTNMFDNIPKCERISMPSKEEFINDYLTRSKPVIITGAIHDWPAVSKWTNEFFRKQYGEREVHIKLTPKGEYEGIEPVEIWESHKTFKIPAEVLKQLPYPDLVMVRPATLNMNFSEFLDLIQNISKGVLTNVSAYLEYTSIADYFPDLKEDVAEIPLLKDVLQLASLNIWLSDGNTLGKAHFDPFDNFLCQINGEKEVTLFEPHNDYLYEAHIPQALLAYNATLKQFQRSTLLDSTAMVMTPVDILQPHLQRFPKFGAARPLSCTIGEGEVLFMPAFWWHEVQSRPSPTQQRNLAINFWYEPFFKKEFPCPECRLDVNPKYRHLL